jgi:hypothetical protein
VPVSARRLAFLAAAIVYAGRGIAVARADQAEECAAAAEEAERLRAASQLRAARERLLVCAHDTCPRVVRNACTVAFEEVERVLPTIVVRAQDSRGHDVVGVRVLVDDTPLLPRLSGTAVAIDPGPHRLRYEANGGDRYEETVLIAVGERERLVTVRFSSPLESDGSRPTSPPTPATPRPAGKRSVFPLVAATTIGVAALGIFSGLHLQAWSDFRTLRDDPCAGTRTCNTVGVRSELVAADVFLGVGIVALGAAALLALPRLMN